MKLLQKTFTLWIVVFFALTLVVNALNDDKKEYKQITYSEFVYAVEAKNISEVTFIGNKKIVGQFKEGYDNMPRFKLTEETGSYILKLLKKHGVTTNYEQEDKQTLATSLLINWGPVILLIVIFYFIFRSVSKAREFWKIEGRNVS